MLETHWSLDVETPGIIQEFGGVACEFWVWAIVEIRPPSFKASWNIPRVSGNLIWN